MTLQQIEFFITVAMHKSFTKAAEILFISQSSVSKQISALEQELGIELFIRNNKAVELSPAGILVYQEFVNGINHINNGVSLALNISSGSDGVLRIAISDQNIDKYLAKPIAAFSRKYPNILLSFRASSQMRFESPLSQNSVDVVFIRSLNIEQQNDISFKKVFEAENYVVVHKNHPHANSPEDFYNNLTSQTFVFPDPHELNLRQDDARILFTNLGYPVPKLSFKPNHHSCLLYVYTGTAAMLADEAVMGIDSPDLVKLPPPKGLKKMKHYAIWKKENVNPAIKFFLNEFDTVDFPVN
jgi:DNA-binding transcriptional LysR family regulator